MTRSDSLTFTPKDIDKLTRAHIGYRQGLGLAGIRPADHHRAQYKKALEKDEEPELKPGYCLKCKDKKEFESKEVHHLKNGAIQHHGSCPDCGGKIVSHLEAKEGKEGSGGKSK